VVDVIEGARNVLPAQQAAQLRVTQQPCPPRYDKGSDRVSVWVVREAVAPWLRWSLVADVVGCHVARVRIESGGASARGLCRRATWWCTPSGDHPRP
jgi:hypothetical protein